MDLVLGQGLALEVLLHQFVVGLGSGLDHLLAPLVGQTLEVGRNVLRLVGHAHVVLVPDDRLHPDQVDDALEVGLGADRNDDRNRVGAQAVAHLAHGLEEVGAVTVHLVDEAHARDLVLVGLAPDGLGLRLHATDGAVDHDRAVEHAHGALDLDREVHVPRGVDDVDPVLLELLVHALPEAGRGRRGDGDAALLLLLHPVHRGGTVMHLAHLVRDTGVEQHALGGGGLARVNVGRDTDVPIAIERSSARHGQILA